MRFSLFFGASLQMSANGQNFENVRVSRRTIISCRRRQLSSFYYARSVGGSPSGRVGDVPNFCPAPFSLLSFPASPIVGDLVARNNTRLSSQITVLLATKVLGLRDFASQMLDPSRNVLSLLVLA